MSLYRKTPEERERDQQMFRELYQDELHYEEPERCKCGEVPFLLFTHGWKVFCRCGGSTKPYTNEPEAIGAWNDGERQ